MAAAALALTVNSANCTEILYTDFQATQSGLTALQKEAVKARMEMLIKQLDPQVLMQFTLNRLTIKPSSSKLLLLYSVVDNALLSIRDKKVARLDLTLANLGAQEIEQFLGSPGFDSSWLRTIFHTIWNNALWDELGVFMEFTSKLTQPAQLAEGLETFKTHIRIKLAPKEWKITLTQNPAVPQVTTNAALSPKSAVDAAAK